MLFLKVRRARRKLLKTLTEEQRTLVESLRYGETVYDDMSSYESVICGGLGSASARQAQKLHERRQQLLELGLTQEQLALLIHDILPEDATKE